MNISDLIVGGMMVVSGTIAMLAHWNRPDRIRGLTYKQFMWCCAIAIVGGVLVASLQFFVER